VTAHDVHLWIAGLDLDAEDVGRLWRLLTEEERHRALLFRFPLHRNRFVAARGLLRRILARYVEQSPEAIRLTIGPNGKPEIACPYPCAIHFNVSHCEAFAAYAIANTRRIGIDIERIRTLQDSVGISRQFFAPEEQVELAAMPHEQKEQGFFACWTRKEAYLKACGLGFSVELDTFAILAAATPRLTRVDWEPDDIGRWTFATFAPCDNYTGTVVVEGTNWTLTQRLWPDHAF